MDYLVVKTIHQGAVALSLTGFFARGLGSLRGAAWVRGGLAKTLPHVVDTVLLLSALTLAWMLRVTPGSAPWLAAKVVGLVVYVGLGVIALKPGRPLRVRAATWIAALATFGWIVSVAITKSPLGILALI
ncbi:MAG: SirB2 family protein [Burkholderiales bacterium]